MNNFKFGKRSKGELDTMHPDLVLIFTVALGRSMVDFGITQGARPVEEQREYYRTGASKLNPDNPDHLKKAKHVTTPERPLALAGDIYAAVPGFKNLAYDHVHLAYLAGVILSTAADLLREGKVTRRLRWGGNWDSDGVLMKDQNFQDLPHFELV